MGKRSRLFTGLDEIREWLKDSLKTKPFCLSIGKDWTKKGWETDLRDIYTDLTLKRKYKKTYGLEAENLTDVTQLLNRQKLGQDEGEGPVRILLTGIFKQRTMLVVFLSHLCQFWKVTVFRKYFFHNPGQGGIGKSTALKHLALNWADGTETAPELQALISCSTSL